MSWSSPDSWLTKLFSGDPLAILIALVITISLPVLTHIYFYTTAAGAPLTPTFLLLGTGGSGKTSLLTLLQRRSANYEVVESSPTRTSQLPTTVDLLLAPSVELGSNKYRSQNDVARQEKTPIRYQMIDTPGHGKLRSEQALSFLDNPAIRGIIFVVDAAALDNANSETVRDTAIYLHDTLLALQRRMTKAKTKTGISLLIAANKQDLFTALPPGAVRDRLEREIDGVRTSRTKGLVRVDQAADNDAEEEVLGGGGEEPFRFKLLQDEYGIVVDIIGGAVRGEEAGKGVQRWEQWIGSCL